MIRKFSPSGVAACVFFALVLTAAVTTGCGGGGGGGGTGPTSGAFNLSGAKFDGAVKDAIIDFFYDSGFTDLVAGVTAHTAAPGNVSGAPVGSYNLTFDSSTLRAGTTILFARSRSGSTGIDTETNLPAAQLSGFTTISGNSARLTLTPLSTIIAQTIAAINTNPTAPSDAEINQALNTSLAIFGLNRTNVRLEDLNSASVSAGTTLFQASRAIIKAAALTSGTLTPTASEIGSYLSHISAGLSTGTPDVDELSHARIILTTTTADNLNRIPLVQALPTFRANSIFVGSTTYPLTGTVTPNGGAPSTTVAATASVAGGGLPNVGINFTGIPSFTVGTEFFGDLTLVVRERGGNRQLTLKVSPFKAVRDNGTGGGTFFIPVGASLSASGRDGNNNIVDTLTVPNISQDPNIDLFLVESITGGSRLTFAAANILSRIAARFHVSPTTHPIGILQSAGNYDVTLTFTGLPLTTQNDNRINQIVLSNLVVTGSNKQ
ncbi:MAG: hypothetical protein HY303_17500 [Candidatus Wallbacteria bacterium]|nr:hypothetical protein [Candidatus Wallbacteria bacterium]